MNCDDLLVPEARESQHLDGDEIAPEPTRPFGKPPTKSKRPYTKHGLVKLKRTVKVLGGRVIDMRTTLGKELAHWRGELIADLGGPETVSTQQQAVVELAVRTKLMLDSIDAWLLTQPSLVNATRRVVLPVVLQRQQLADGLARYLTQLGLERRAKKATDLKTYLAEQYGNGKRKKADGPTVLTGTDSAAARPTQSKAP